MNAADIIEERVAISAPDRRIEGTLAYRLTADPAWSCLLAGPHPLLGGEMGNNVLRALATACVASGAAVMSFNYAGVGGSEGGPADWPAAISTFWREARVPDESAWREDAAAALATLMQQCPSLPCVAIGYSFGCWAVAEAAVRRGVPALVFISPNPQRHDFAALEGAPMPLLVVHSDCELDCPSPCFAAWYAQLREPKRRSTLAAGEHFFRGHEGQLVEVVRAFLGQCGLDVREGKTP